MSFFLELLSAGVDLGSMFSLHFGVVGRAGDLVLEGEVKRGGTVFFEGVSSD